MDRRKFLTAVGSLIADSVVVRAASIMPVKRPPLVTAPLFAGEIGQYNGVLIRYRKEVFREYVSRNLFSPYTELSLDSYGQRISSDLAGTYMPEDQGGELPDGDVDFAFDDPDEWRDFSEEDEDDGESIP